MQVSILGDVLLTLYLSPMTALGVLALWDSGDASLYGTWLGLPLCGSAPPT